MIPPSLTLPRAPPTPGLLPGMFLANIQGRGGRFKSRRRLGAAGADREANSTEEGAMGSDRVGDPNECAKPEKS